MPRAINLISGPSRTGDIEQTIVLGAHGPYRVHILLVRLTDALKSGCDLPLAVVARGNRFRPRWPVDCILLVLGIIVSSVAGGQVLRARQLSGSVAREC